MLSLTVTAQTLVNREWVAQYGLPDTVAWSASTADGSGLLYTATVPHNLAASSTILDSWTRGSTSDVLLAPQTQAGTSVLALSGDPGFVLSNVTPASATNEGYVYDVKSTFGGTPINTWFPFDPNTEQGRFAWTLHTIGATVSTPSLELSSFRANLYPNPVAHKAYISIEGFSGNQFHIDMLDATGSNVGQWDETITDRGKHSFTVDVSYLPTGLYLVRISNPHFSTTLKLIKP